MGLSSPPSPLTGESLPRTRYGGWGEGDFLPSFRRRPEPILPALPETGESLPRTRYGGWG